VRDANENPFACFLQKIEVTARPKDTPKIKYYLLQLGLYVINFAQTDIHCQPEFILGFGEMPNQVQHDVTPIQPSLEQ
jgi:hypothetical protein